jgi:hypothetical protein
LLETPEGTAKKAKNKPKNYHFDATLPTILRHAEQNPGSLHSLVALQQAQVCLGATTEPISHVMLMLQPVVEPLRLERTTRVIRNERPQESHA